MTGLAVIFGFVVIILEQYREWSERKHRDSFSTERISPLTSYLFNVCKKILLGLSDTQLLTGLGMQLAVLFIHCGITIYHFWIAINLAYLSTITHLLTMVALKSYFIEHRMSSILRLFLIVFNVGLFCYAAFILDGLSYANNFLDGTQLLACYYQGNRPSLKNPSFAGHWFTIIVIVIIVHAIILWHVFIHVEKEQNTRSWWKRWLSRLTIFLVGGYMILAFVATVPVLGDTEAMGSPSKVNITMDNTHGSERDWGFGQILPILLLALPVLAGWEAAFGTPFALI